MSPAAAQHMEGDINMSGNILLVEDEKSLNRAVSLKLFREGYRVYQAETLAQAQKIYENNDIQLIICDIGLPDGNGLDFCAKVRSVERPGSVVFLFLTAMDTEEDIVRGYDAGGDDYVTKPFSLTVLVSKVNAIMDRYGGVVNGTSGGRPAAEAKHIIRSADITMDMDKNRAAKRGNISA